MTPVAALIARLLAAPAAAGQVAGPSPPIAVEVDVAIAEGDALAARIAAAIDPLAHVEPTAITLPTRVVVQGELLAFRVGVVAADAGSTAWTACPCTHAELVTHVQHRLAAALRPRPRCPLPRVIAPEAPPAPARIESRRLGRAARLGVVLVGVGGLALGAGAGAVAAAAMARDERWIPRTDLRPAGVALVAAGAGALATGALSLLLDRSPRPHHARVRVPSS